MVLVNVPVILLSTSTEKLQLELARIVAPVIRTDVVLGSAVTTAVAGVEFAQVVDAFAAAAMNTPVGKLSVSSTLVRSITFGLVNVIVNRLVSPIVRNEFAKDLAIVTGLCT